MTDLPILQPRSCGPCTMCCKVLGVEELEKQPNEWCPHVAKGQGCQIYADRPPTCKEFECLWLQNPEMPEELRPDRSKVVLASLKLGDGMSAHVDPGYPHAAETGVMKEFLKVLANKGVPTIVCCGAERAVYYSRSNTPERLLKIIDQLGVQSK